MSVGLTKALEINFPPANVLSEAESTLQETLDAQASDSKMSKSIRAQVFQIARTQIPHAVALLGQEDRETDTLLEINVPRLTLPCTCARCRVEVHAEVRLFQAQGGKKLYEARIDHSSEPAEFTEWARNGGELFQKKLDLVVQQLAEHIVEDVFLLYVIP